MTPAFTFTFRDPQPSSGTLDWFFKGVIRMVQVERLFGNHIHDHDHDPDLKWVELKASRRRYCEYLHDLKRVNRDFDVDKCFAWLRAEALRQGCVFESRSGEWFIVRDARWMSLLNLQPAYCLESYLEDLITVKEINRAEYVQNSAEMDIVRKQIVLTIYEYRCAMHPAAVDYLADLWLTTFGFRGKNELRQYVVGLAAGPLTKALGDLWMMCWFNLDTDVILKTFQEEELRDAETTILDTVLDAFEEDFDVNLLKPWK